MTANGKIMKIMILGEAGVGKSSLIKKFTNGTFSSRMSSTVGVDKISNNFKLNKDSATINLQLLDTAGALKFQGILKSYMSSIDAVILMYDISNKETFAALPMWVSLLHSACQKGVVKLLLGNKLDLQREVMTKNAKNYADFEGMFSMETSVKDEKNIHSVFELVIRELQLKKVL